MAANKVVYGGKILIDLTGDTVTEDALFAGYTAHKADGTIITGTAFAGYPNEYVFLDIMEDLNGKSVTDNTSDLLLGRTVYRKARSSVILDSSGDAIDDSM